MTKLYLLFAIALFSSASAFSQACPAVTSFSEDFTNVTPPALPTCWERLGTGGSVSTQSTDANSSPNALYLASPSTNSIGMVASPTISNLRAGTHQLRFSMRAAITAGSSVEIGYMNNPNNPATFRVISTVVATSLTYQMYTIKPGNLGGSGDFIAFRHTGVLPYAVLIDDVVWEPIPTCLPPANITVSSITTSGATINWTAPATPVTNYQLYINQSSTPPSITTPADLLAIQNPLPIANLLPNTTYYVWVRSNCGVGGLSAWSLAQTFTTACLTSGLPYAQNFDAVTAPALPSCVSVQDINADLSTWSTITAPAGYTGNVLAYRFNATNAANDWFYTNGLNLTAGKSYILRYKFSNSLNYSESMRVAIGSLPAAGSMSTVLADYPVINDNIIRTHAIRFTVPATGVYYVGFQAYSVVNQSEIFLDNISVTEAAVAPTALNACSQLVPLRIDALNNTKWMALTDVNGNIVAEINANGNNLGEITSKVYRNNGPVRKDFSGRFYLDRNIEITPTLQPSTPVSVRLYFTSAEFGNLQAQPGVDLPSFTNLSVFKNDDPCGSTIIGGALKLNTSVAPYETNFVATFDIPDFSSFYIASSAYAVLPAQLITFSGLRQGSGNQLRWTVAQEQDVLGYQVERSENGANWNALGTVNSLGNTTAQRSYTFFDQSPTGARQLYRLRQRERSGAEKLSQMITISGGKALAFSITGLYPNPAFDKVQLALAAPEKETVTLMVLDATGRIVRSQRHGVDIGNNTIDVNLTGLSQGTYLLKIDCSKGCNVQSERFLKK